MGRAAVIIKITADDGTVGWGQSVPVEKWSYETLETAEAELTWELRSVNHRYLEAFVRLPDELRALASRAGFERVRVRRHLPWFRISMVLERS